jgi:hypothetical protein
MTKEQALVCHVVASIEKDAIVRLPTAAGTLLVYTLASILEPGSTTVFLFSLSALLGGQSRQFNLRGLPVKRPQIH